MKKSRLNPISKKKRTELTQEARIKMIIYNLGNGLCELCGRHKISDRGHEIVFRSHGGSSLDPFNVIQLCVRCHKKEHNLLKDEKADSADYLLSFIKAKRKLQGFKEDK